MPVDVLSAGLMSRIATSYNDYYIGNNIDTLTVINNNTLLELSSPSNTRY